MLILKYVKYNQLFFLPRRLFLIHQIPNMIARKRIGMKIPRKIPASLVLGGNGEIVVGVGTTVVGAKVVEVVLSESLVVVSAETVVLVSSIATNISLTTIPDERVVLDKVVDSGNSIAFVDDLVDTVSDGVVDSDVERISSVVEMG